jgi:hypothetical protein
VESKIAARPERSHGYRYKGQYEAQVAQAGLPAAGAAKGVSAGTEEEMGVPGGEA